MSDEEQLHDYKTRGIDYDLYACLKCNPQPILTFDDIARVIAVHEGMNDGEDWRWILELTNGNHAFLQGGCDYTGWDCQSSAVSTVTHSALDAAQFALHPPTQERWIHDGSEEVYKSLIRQITEGKAQTWRDKAGEDLGWR